MFDSIETAPVQDHKVQPSLVGVGARVLPFPLRSTKPEPFRPRAYLRCVALGHDMVASRSHPGRITCRRCRLRRTY